MAGSIGITNACGRKRRQGPRTTIETVSNRDKEVLPPSLPPFLLHYSTWNVRIRALYFNQGSRPLSKHFLSMVKKLHVDENEF